MPSVAASSSKAAAKPYDRPSAKGKGKAVASSSTAGVNVGAPAQHGQKSRKGKKAWRKNVDIADEEAAMEQAREEERVTGGKLADKSNTDLFTIDTVGDVQVAQKIRRAPKPLRSLAVLDERSAVPSLTSRPPSSAAKAKKLTGVEKERLRRIARRTTAATDEPSTSADVRATALANTDVWDAVPVLQPVGGFGEETMVTKAINVPRTIARQRENYVVGQLESGRGTELPGAGTSYNPSEEAHQRLLALALAEEEERLRKEAEEAARIARLAEVVNARRSVVRGVEYAPGMTVGPGEAADEDEAEGEEGWTRVKPKGRKTQAQRNKAARNKERARLEALEKTQKKLVKQVGSVQNLKASVEARARLQAEADRMAKLVKSQKERMGLEGGEKVGKHRVAKGAVTVQLGEDLAESLRQIKPEGNAFKDRFLALQKKALIEPRVPQLPKKKNRTKEYEKHAYKRFV